MTTFDAFVASYHEHFTRDPYTCLELGVDRHRDELPDRSPTATAATVAEARALLAELDGLSAQALGFDDALDRDMARLTLEREVFELTYTFNGGTMRQQCPKLGDDLGNGITLLLSSDPRPDAERLADVTGRLEKVPALCASWLASLTVPVARWVAMDLAAVGGMPGLFDTLDAWAESSRFPDRERLRRARATAEAALHDYAERLAALPTTTSFHIGLEQTRRLVALRGIDRSLDDLHAMATRFLAENRARTATLAKQLATTYKLPADTSVDALQAFLAKSYRVKRPRGQLEDVLDRYEQERDRLRDFIEERELFPLPDDEQMHILRTPDYLTATIPAGAMWAPAAFRPGTKTSLVMLTLSEELLDEHTELSVPGMMLHEGIPGHHLQLSWAALHPSTVRRHYSGNEHHEGWTTYLEDYMLDVGYAGDLEDEMRFVGQRDIARVGARVAIDLFFMSGERRFLDVGVACDTSSDDPFVAAGNLLAAVTGFVPGRVQAELNWYSCERGYPLSYLTGNRMLWELKGEVQAANAGKLDGLDLDRAFHRAFLLAGNMPLATMRRVMEHEGLLPAG